MCRYTEKQYKTSFACFDDRQVSQYDTWLAGHFHPCPKCREPMIEMGQDWKAPRKRDDKGWRISKVIADALPRPFDSCGCSGPGARPTTLREAVEFSKRQRAYRATLIQQRQIGRQMHGR